MTELGNLSEFKDMEVELYRSSDIYNTMVYFGNKEKHENYFELLVFKYTYEQKHQVYLKYPNTEHFVQLTGQGENSRGIMINRTVENIFAPKHRKLIEIQKFGENALIKFGSEFNFLKRVAYCEKVNQIGSHERLSYVNVEELEKALQNQYIKISEDIREVEYCAKTVGRNPTYFLVHGPKYNFRYDNQKFFVIKKKVVTEMKVLSMERYRDGGTTYIKVLDEHDVEHTFFSPTVFDSHLNKTWDGEKLENASAEEEENLINLLKLTLSYENA